MYKSSLLAIIVFTFFIALLVGPIVIPILKKLKIGQNVREDGPQNHLSKSGTPTMGGIIIFLSLGLGLLIGGKINRETLILLLASLAFGLIGFMDDYIKVVKKRNLGLRAKEKLIGQAFFALLLAFYHSRTSLLGTKLIVPFIKDYYLDLGVLYIPFIAFVIVSIVNSVNLTDGLDGLASGVTAIVLGFFTLISFIWKMENIAYFSASLLGACLGFLIYNFYPAKVFMGDTGSMGLGGAVSVIAIFMNLPLIIPILGGIYFIEALSVIIQVISFKTRGKRVFLMSPLHHHFEHKGWKETKVVLVFWFVTLLLSFIAYYAII